MRNLDNFFKPQSVAIIGASGDSNKVGYSLVKNILESGCPKIFPITLNAPEILGMPALKSILEVNESIDLAVIAVKAEIVPQVLADCAKKQIKNAIIVSSGFKETGEQGREFEEQINHIATENDMNILGPNCLGFIDAKNNLNASFAGQKTLSGKIALLSQSGALGTAMLDWAQSEGVGFSKFISLGNEAGLDESDFLEYFKRDNDTDAILMYLEKVNDGRRLTELLKEITPHKPVVVLKAGVSDYGASAIRSHTGSLAPDSKVFEAACEASGAVLVNSVAGLFNISKILSLGIRAKKLNLNLTILTNGGGPSVIAADEVGSSESISLAALSDDTKSRLKSVLPQTATINNPIDIMGDALPQRYEAALDILCEAENIDAILTIITPQMMTDMAGTARVLGKYKTPKIFPVFMGGDAASPARKILAENGLVNFDFSSDVIRALDRLSNFKKEKKKAASANALAQMPFVEASALLSAYGIEVNGAFVVKKEDLGAAVSILGSGPYVLKSFSSDAVHKTEAGAVHLNLLDMEQLYAAWDEMDRNIEGMLVQKMGKGREIIIGMKRDATFGPTILFGLGGIFTEVLQDTVLRVAPLSKDEALEMMRGVKGKKILEGTRGEKSVNFNALADIMVNLSHLALEHPEIKEIDLNPVICSATEATVVDARLMI